MAHTSTGQPATVSGTLPFLIQDVGGAELFGLFMFLRIARAPAQYVTDSSFVEQGVNQRGRSATVANTSAWAGLWRDVWCEIGAWRGLGDNLSVRKVKVHTTPEEVLVGPMIRLGKTWTMQLASWWFWNTAPHRTSAERGSQPFRPSRAGRTGLPALALDIDSTWLPGRGRATARRRERERPWPLPLPALPTIWRRGNTFVDRCSRCPHPERATRGRCPSAAQRFRLDGSAGHRIVDLPQGGMVVSVLCVVCGSSRGSQVATGQVPRYSATWKATGSA